MAKTNKKVQISHDPFSRESIYRQRVYGHECCECDRPAKWEYFVQGDGLGAFMWAILGYFCSISCMRSYNRQRR